MKTKLITIALFLSFGIIGSTILVRSNVSAQSGVSDSINITKQQTIDKTLVSGASDIEIAGVLNGDLFCLSQNLNVSGTINGDVFCAASNVNITGNINGSLRLFSSNTTIVGTVDEASTILTDDFTLDKAGFMGSDVFLTATNAQINGLVDRDLNILGDNYFVNGTINRNIAGNANQLTLQKNATVLGNVDITSQNKISTEDGAIVLGTLNQINESSEKSNPILDGLFFALYMIASLALIAILIALLMPRTLEYSFQIVKNNPFKVALAGLIVSIVGPVLFILLFITIIGIPLAFMLILGWILVASITGPIVAFQIGKAILRKNKKAKPVVCMILGSSILLVVYLIPIVNIFIMTVVYIYGLGIVALIAKNKLIGKI